VPINKNCPWSGDKVQNDSLTQYKGYEVGFCNTGCRDKFDKATALFDEKIDACDFGLVANFRRYAHYNQWMNKNLYKLVGELSVEQFNQDQGAFFSSIKGTLNHILVWDTTWLQRFAEHTIVYTSLDYVLSLDKPYANEQVLHDDIDDLQRAREKMDKTFINFCQQLKESDFNTVFTYQMQSGKKHHKNFGGMLQHVFNHQTHHRGQLTTLLSQMDINPGVTDLLVTLCEEANDTAL